LKGWLANFEECLKGKPSFIDRPELDQAKATVEKNLPLSRPEELSKSQLKKSSSLNRGRG